MQPWYTSDLAANYRWQWRGHTVGLTAELNNLLNQQYDVILNYPMPGRNAAVGLTFEL